MFSAFFRIDKWAYKLLFYIICFGSIFFWTQNASANQSQLIGDLECTGNLNLAGSVCSQYGWTNTTTMSTNIISRIDTYVSFSDNDCAWQLCTSDIGGGNFQCSNNSVIEATTNETVRQWDFTGSTRRENELGYFFYQSSNAPAETCSGLERTGTLRGTTGNPYIYATTTGASAINDWYFATYANPSTPNTTTIRFSTTPTTTCDFSNWSVYYSMSSSTTATLTNGDYGISVMSGFSPEAGSMTNQDFDNFSDWFSGTSTISVSATSLIPKDTPLTPGFTFYAQASLCNSLNPDDCEFNFSSDRSEHQIASSSVWQFIIDDASNPILVCPANNGQVAYQGLVTPSVTSTQASNNITCDPNSGFFQSSMCYLFQYLFFPKTESIRQFSSIQERISNKAPFGYISVFSSQISNLSSASSTTSTAFSSISSSEGLQLSTWSTLAIFETIRTIFNWFLWIVFVFYVFHRFKNFSLHG